MKKNFVKKISATVSVVAIVALVLAGCSGNGGQANNLRLVSSTPPNTLNHIRNSEAANSEVIGQFLEGLVQYDADNKLIPSIAESWTTNDDSSVYTFTIRSDAKWSNGTPVTANDFVFGFTTLATDKEAPYGTLAAILKNGQAVLDGTTDASELGVKALSDSQLEVTLEQPLAYFLDLMAFMPFFPLNEAFYNEVGGAEVYGTTMETTIGNGPFKLTSYKPDQGWEFAKNNDYWDASNVSLETVSVRFIAENSTAAALYDSGEIDRLVLTADLVDKYKDSPDLVTQPGVSIRYFYMSGTTSTPDVLLSNQNFRAAVAHSIDKAIVTDSVLKDGSLPADYLVPKGFAELEGKDFRDYSGKYNTPMFDVAKAQEYLTAAKAELGDTPLNFTIAIADTEANKKIYENIESQIETNLPGVDVTINQVPAQLYYPKLYELSTPAAHSGWTPDYLDVSTYLSIFRSYDSGNFGQFNNADYDALYAGAEAPALVDNQAARWDKFVEAESILLDNYSAVPIYQTGIMSVIKPNVKGFAVYPTAPTLRFKYVTVS